MDEKIDKNLVKNKDVLSLIESSVICEICKGILNNPLKCSVCESSFCKNCIENWKKENTDKQCFNKCQNPTFKTPKEITNFMKNMIFNCKNGCNEDIPYLELEDHYKNKCPKKKMDNKSEYFDYKNKYEDLLKKCEELEKKNKELEKVKIAYKKENDDDINNKNIELKFKSQYHDHTLKYKTLFMEDWNCNICDFHFDKKTKSGYECEICRFKICAKCKIIEKSGYIFKDIYNSKKHHHLLKEEKHTGNFRCDICQTVFNKNVNSFRCTQCNFDLCFECKKRENETN